VIAPRTHDGSGTLRPRRRVALGLTVVIAILIGWLTLTPTDQQPSLFFMLPDKAYHAIAFAALILPASVLLVSGLSWVLAAALLFGGAIELIQPQVGRSADLLDMVANMAGLAAGVAIGFGLRRLNGRRAAARTPST
jgi:VanZ family protein